MQVIYRYPGSSRRAVFQGPRFIVTVALSAILMMATVFYMGKEYGASRARAWLSYDQHSDEDGLGHTHGQDQGEFQALMVRLGQLQSQMLRLNAVGQRVVEKLNVDSDEFDFSEVPGVGGLASDEAGPVPIRKGVKRVMAVLSKDMAQREVQLKTLETLLYDDALTKETRPTGNPVKNGHLSSKFGWRIDPFTGRRKFHHGIDLAAKRGSEVVAVASGMVTWAGKRGGYGKMVEITHADGFVTRYGHSSKVSVSVGQVVRRGETIARVGSTGRSTGPHLHFEVLKHGKKVNPIKYLKTPS